MENNLFIFNFNMRNNYKTLIALSLVILFVFLVKNIFPEPKRNKVLESKFWIDKAHSVQKKNIVVGGDSRVYRGVSINGLCNGINADVTGINLGYPSAGYSLDYLDFLRSNLNVDDSVKILLLGITPNSLTNQAAKNEAFYQYKKIDKISLLKAKYLYQPLSFFAPYTVIELINYILGRNLENGYFENYKENGWVASYKIPYDTTEALRIYTKVFISNKVSCDILDDLVLKLNEFQNEGIDVYAFRPPTTLQLKQMEDSLSGFNEKLVVEKLKNVGGVRWINIEIDSYKTYDGSHLHYTFAEKLSATLAEDINSFYLKLDMD